MNCTQNIETTALKHEEVQTQYHLKEDTDPQHQHWGNGVTLKSVKWCYLKVSYSSQTNYRYFYSELLLSYISLP